MSQHGTVDPTDGTLDMSGIVMRAFAALVVEALDTDAGSLGTFSAEDIHLRLLKAACDPDWGALEAAVCEIVDDGTSRRTIANIYIPRVARALGKAWSDNEMEFATVSVGCARLQGYLRQKGLEWCKRIPLNPVQSTVVLIVPEFEQHTLGATLLAGQLRAHGVCVVSHLHAAPREIGRIVRHTPHDAVMISSSQSETLRQVKAVVKSLRLASPHAPIIIGGNLVEQGFDIIKRTGADHAINSCRQAIALLKMAQPRQTVLAGETD